MAVDQELYVPATIALTVSNAARNQVQVSIA